MHRLAWTVADLRGLDRPGLDEVDTALRLRTGDPLLLSMLEQASDERSRRRPPGPGGARPRSPSPGDPRLADLVAGHGALAIHDRLLGDHDVEDLQTDPAARRSATDPERALADAARLGLRFVIPGDPEWPAQLDDLARRAAAAASAAACPLGLWVRGPVRLDQLAGSVAVVGSRSATTYGADVAAEIAADRGGGRAVRRLGRGVRDRPGRPPRCARRRRRRPSPCSPAAPTGSTRPRTASCSTTSRAHGAVVSESLPGWAPTRLRFLSRNRLIAALTTGTVVVEAAIRSGALNTANWAARLNRHLLGVPGPVTSATVARACTS